MVIVIVMKNGSATFRFAAHSKTIAKGAPSSSRHISKEFHVSGGRLHSPQPG